MNIYKKHEQTGNKRKTNEGQKKTKRYRTISTTKKYIKITTNSGTKFT